MSGFASAIGLVAALACLLAASAGAVVFDDVSPCPAAYTEQEGEEPRPAPPFVCPGGLVGTPYALQLVGRGGCEPYFSFTVIGGTPPPGLVLSATGALAGTPTQSGNWAFRVRVRDRDTAHGGPDWCATASEAEGEFTLEIRPGVVVTTEPAPPATIGAPYNLALSAQTTPRAGQLVALPGCTAHESVRGLCPLTWSVTEGRLPTGLRLNSVTGAIVGTPTAEGSSSFVVRALHEDGRAATKTLAITVRQRLAVRAAKPFGTSGSRARWEVGLRLRATFAATGGASPYSWSLAAGTLPAGLALGADGSVRGTPRSAGRFAVAVRVRDEEGRTAEYRTVLAVAPRLAITTRELRSGKVGLSYRATLAARGGVPHRNWTIVQGSLPNGIDLDRRSGELTGRPSRQGRYRVTVQARDRLGVTSRRAFVLIVRSR